MILDKKNKKKARDFFSKVVDTGLNFKLQENVINRHISVEEGMKLISDLPKKGKPVDDVLKEFQKNILPYCTNFSSKNFMGFPDAGNSVASIGGGILDNFLQQNLINQSFCAPSATFVEIAVLRWLRETVGYQNHKIRDIWDVGGVITPGGTSSNTIGILLARENKFPGTMTKGIADPEQCYLIVPKGIGHYSVKSGQMWIGCGNRLIEAETKNFRYDLHDLKKKLLKNKGRVMCVVAYAGDSRTMTVDHFDQVAKVVKSIDQKIWLHADACHGFSLGFSNKLRHKIKGIEDFDSITMDPHKVLVTPYTISALLVKDPQKMKSVTSLSDLIMQEQFAFGQITPFLGSRSWDSLKLWFIMKNLGKSGLEDLIDRRHELAEYLADKLDRDNDFILINEVEINSVAFLYKRNLSLSDIDRLNDVNKKIHQLLIEEGKYHLHQFSIPDSGKIKKGAVIYPQRYMCGNPNTTKRDVDKMIEYVRQLGTRVVSQYQR